MSRNKLYYIVLALAMAGYVWLFWNYKQFTSGDKTVSVCLFKNITGLPCPSCGTTHALLYLMNGKPLDALGSNPLGFILAFMLLVFPTWIIADLILRKNSFHSFYNKSEKLIIKKWVALPAVILVILIWIINIKKAL